MRRRRLLLGCTVLVLVACAAAAAAERYYFWEAAVQRDLGQLHVLEGELLQWTEQEPNNSEAWWQLAGVQFSLAQWQEPEQRRRGYETAWQTAERSKELNPQCPHGHYWSAVARARSVEDGSLLQRLRSIRPLQEALYEVLAMEPTHADAHLVLSILYRTAPGSPLSIGSSRKSLEHAIAADQLVPNDAEILWNLAEAYEAAGQPAAALGVTGVLAEHPAVEFIPNLGEQMEAMKSRLQ